MTKLCPTAWVGKGLTLYKLGKYKEAIGCSDKALEIDPKDVLAMKVRDMVLKQMEKQPGHHYKSKEPRGKKSRRKRIFRYSSNDI
jgi:tetratricopeptide (TPR) repeat protein